MPAISTLSGARARGAVTSSPQSWVTVDGNAVVVRGSRVARHPPCPQVIIHCNASTSGGSSLVSIDGIPVNRDGDTASCGHSLTGGRSWVDVG